MKEVLCIECQEKFRLLNLFLISGGLKRIAGIMTKKKIQKLVEFAFPSVLIHHQIEYNLKDEYVRRHLFCLSYRHLSCHGRDLLLKIQILQIMKWKLE